MHSIKYYHLNLRHFFAFSMLISVFALPVRSQVTVQVNCAQWAEYPLVKKIGLYQTPLVSREWISRDFPKLDELEARSMRYEMACGKDDLYGQPCVTGTTSSMKVSLNEICYLLTLAQKYSPVLVISHGYTPTILQKRPTEWSGFMDPPTDMKAWATINRRFANNWKSRKYTNSYVEVWNEPDLTDGFFTGTVDDYLDIYEAAAPAVKEGYSDMKVGGPAGAFNWWHQPLVNRVKAKNLPLDFLSGHAYGADYSWQIDGMRNALKSLGNNEAEMLLTEYSPYPAAEYQKDGPVEKAEAAMTFFNALPGMLECPDLTFVNWAQYIDPGFFVGDKLGLVDRDSGSRKALFNAFKLYGMMPADRIHLTGTNSVVKGMASASSNRVTAVLWNTSDSEQTVKVNLTRLPFTSGTLQVFHIDEGHNSWYETKNDALVASRSEHVDASATNSIALDDVVRGKGVYFVLFDSDENDAPQFPQVDLGTIVRTHYWFPKRESKVAYANFDPKTWTVRLSANGDATGRALVGVEVEKLPDYVKVDGIRKGTPARRNNNSSINIRLDYQNVDGAYVKSVLFHDGSFNEKRTEHLPWGTQKEPDDVVEVTSLSDFTIPVVDYKPEKFSGRVFVSFDMNSVGLSVKQNFQLLPGEPTGIGQVRNTDEDNFTSTENGIESVYSLAGIPLSHPVPGINIVKMHNGDTRKVYIRE